MKPNAASLALLGIIVFWIGYYTALRTTEREAIKKEGICTHYIDDHAIYTFVTNAGQFTIKVQVYSK